MPGQKSFGRLNYYGGLSYIYPLLRTSFLTGFMGMLGRCPPTDTLLSDTDTAARVPIPPSAISTVTFSVVAPFINDIKAN